MDIDFSYLLKKNEISHRIKTKHLPIFSDYSVGVSRLEYT